MKSVFLSVVILLMCSGCVLADLEFYPDYKRSEADVSEEEWIKDPQPSSDLQRYLQEASLLYRQDKERSSYPYGGLRRAKPNKEVDPSWPSTLARHLLNNKELALRLLQRNEKLQEPIRKQQYFKILPSGRDTKTRGNRLIEGKEANALLSLFEPHFETDTQLADDDSENFEFGDEDDDAVEEVVNEEDHGHHIDSEESPRREAERSNDPMYDIDNVNNPTEFAFDPSDPRYFVEAEKEKADTEEPTFYIKPDDDMEDNDVDNFAYTKSFEKHAESIGNGDGNAVDVIQQKSSQIDDTAGVYIIAVVAGISAAATVGLIAFAIGWYNLQKHVKDASDVDYPAYGITGPNKDISPSSGDRRLAQSAQMYHYQHQKQQIIAMERAAANERHGSVSEAESDEENEEGDYTVYECPGLAPTGEMEVKNPLFQDDPTPAQTPAVKSSENGGVVPKK